MFIRGWLSNGSFDTYPADGTGASHYYTSVILPPRLKKTVSTASAATSPLPPLTQSSSTRDTAAPGPLPPPTQSGSTEALVKAADSATFSYIFPQRRKRLNYRCLFVSLDSEAALADDDCFGLRGFFFTFFSATFFRPLPTPTAATRKVQVSLMRQAALCYGRPCSQWRKGKAIAEEMSPTLSVQLWKSYIHTRRCLTKCFSRFRIRFRLMWMSFMPTSLPLIWYWYKTRSHLARYPPCLYL